MWYRALLMIPLVVSGCAPVTMVNPLTGETAVCREDYRGPWSQQESCAGRYFAEGWKKLDER